MHQAIGMPRAPVAGIAVWSLAWMITTRMHLKRNTRLHHRYQELLAPVCRLVHRRAD